MMMKEEVWGDTAVYGLRLRRLLSGSIFGRGVIIKHLSAGGLPRVEIMEYIPGFRKLPHEWLHGISFSMFDFQRETP